MKYCCASLLFLSSTAHAFSYESPVSDPCHERLTIEALRAARSRVPALARVVGLSEDDAALIRDLPFVLEEDFRDLAAASLLIGVRDNDLKGLNGIDTTSLALVHGDPDNQREHCLRRPEHDGAEGSFLALEECRGFIRENIRSVVERGLDSAGLPDPSKRTIVDVTLTFSGRVSAQLPIAWVYLGQALHTLQDSFSHTYRTADHRRVTVVLNWVEAIGEDYKLSRDGPVHLTGLDQCEGTDEVLQARRSLAEKVSAELIVAALSPEIAASERLAAVDLVLDEYLTLEAGCSAENRWCDALENKYSVEGCSCNSASSSRSGWAAVLVLLLLLLRRRAVFLLFFVPSVAFAQPVATSSRACVPGRQIECACPGGARGAQVCSDDGSRFGLCLGCETSPAASLDPPADHASRTPFGLHLGGSAALDNTALAISVGIRYRTSASWLFGFDGEFNPWGSLESQRFSLGALNFYGVLIRRWEISDWVALRTTGRLGASILLTDLVGARQGSTGLFLALSLLGLEFELDDHWTLAIDPADLAVPVPHLRGAPLSYRQYRFTISFQLDAARPRPLISR